VSSAPASAARYRNSDADGEENLATCNIERIRESLLNALGHAHAVRRVSDFVEEDGEFVSGKPS
jgi:hypothetical protein